MKNYPDQAVRKARALIATITGLAFLLVLAVASTSQGYVAEPRGTARFGEVNESSSDSIVLQSSDTYCRGGDPTLTVKGENVSWYADAAKTTQLAVGNTYHAPSLDQTTTFYLTQTVNGIESPAQPITIEMVETILVNVVTTPAHCGKNDGTITITATGGTARNPLQYQLNNGHFQSSPVFTNLPPGTYTVINRVASCWGATDFTVDQIPPPTISAIDSIVPHCGNADGSLTIFAAGGSGSYSYSLNGVDFKTNNRFNHLAGGTYTLTVRDDLNACTVSKSVSLSKTVRLQLTGLEIEPTTCGKANGQIRINMGPSNGPVTYSLTGHADQLSPLFDSLPAGDYRVSVKDERECIDSTTGVVASSQGPAITQILTQSAACGIADGRLTIIATSLSPLSYSLNGNTYQQDASFDQLAAGEYAVAIKDEVNCVVRQTVKLGDPCGDGIYLPDAFTPNGDGINDGWAIFFPHASLQLEELTLFNRWGDIILHHQARVIHSGDVLWNSRHAMQSGTYSYQLRVRLPTGQNQVYRGSVIVLGY